MGKWPEVGIMNQSSETDKKRIKESVCVHGAQRIGRTTEHLFPTCSPWQELPKLVVRSLILRKTNMKFLAERTVKVLHCKRQQAIAEINLTLISWSHRKIP